MSFPGIPLQARSGLIDAASHLGAHAHSALRWNIVLPVLVAILFFGAFTTVYILMRRPSFGERGVTRDLTPDAAHVASRP
ncbi:MAG TPA: hypothetical protein VII60_04600 [Acidimicrobiales bacterium]